MEADACIDDLSSHSQDEAPTLSPENILGDTLTVILLGGIMR